MRGLQNDTLCELVLLDRWFDHSVPMLICSRKENERREGKREEREEKREGREREEIRSVVRFRLTITQSWALMVMVTYNMNRGLLIRPSLQSLSSIFLHAVRLLSREVYTDLK